MDTPVPMATTTPVPVPPDFPLPTPSPAAVARSTPAPRHAKAMPTTTPAPTPADYELPSSSPFIHPKPAESQASATPMMQAQATPARSKPAQVPAAPSMPTLRKDAAVALIAGNIDAPPSSDSALFAPPPVAESRQAPSQNVTINLINRLVERGILTKEDSSDLIKQAEQDAVVARKQAVEDATAAARDAVPEPPSDDAVRVAYVPEVVKQEMRDQIKQEVLAQARDEKWAAPNAVPEWVSRFRFFGDIRVRYEGDFYPTGNDNTGAFPNFNAINTGAPFDVAGSTFSPQYNVDQNRNRFRLRARGGADVDLGEGFTAGLRIATGENDSPVTENQSLGASNNGQGGNFSKYAIWLDRAFLKYQIGGLPNKDLSIMLGRFDNPFFSTTAIWADDLGFDGFALKGKYDVGHGVTPFVTLGAFPVFNTDFNFSTNNPAKFKSEDKYLYAIQAGAEWKINNDFTAKLAAALYDYQNIEGKLSSPFTPLTSSDQGDTDDSRPAFAQNGNTYMAIRDIVPTAQNNFGTTNQFQYFGLATPFRELAITGRLDYNHYDPFHVALTGEWVTNLAFDRNSIANKAVNNFGANNGVYAGGNNAWIVNLKVGSAALENRWDWNLGVNYRYVESDSVVDGFNDSDFGSPLTGTNLKGYTVYGSLALSPRVWLFLRYMSANSIAGPPYRNDILQLDVNTKF